MPTLTLPPPASHADKADGDRGARIEHGVHAAASGADANEPNAHGVQPAWPAADWRMPGGHARHTALPDELNEPGAQRPVALVRPVDEQYEPGAHGVGEAMAADAHSEPDGQGSGAALPGAQYWPGAQAATAAVRPVRLQNAPPGHGKGVRAPALRHTKPCGHTVAEATIEVFEPVQKKPGAHSFLV